MKRKIKKLIKLDKSNFDKKVFTDKCCKLLILLQILDFLCTYIGVSIYGAEAEGNPLIKSLIESRGVFIGIAIPKLLIISYLSLLIHYYKEPSMSLCYIVLFCIVLYNLAVGSWLLIFFMNYLL